MAEGFMTAGGVDTSDMTTTAADVLEGKTFINAEGDDDIGTMPNRGQYQWAGGVGFGTDSDGTEYVAFNNIPEGAYFKNDYDWAPEIRVNRTDVFSTIGASTARSWSGQYDTDYNEYLDVRGGNQWGQCHVISVTATPYDGGVKVSMHLKCSIEPYGITWDCGTVTVDCK